MQMRTVITDGTGAVRDKHAGSVFRVSDRKAFCALCCICPYSEWIRRGGGREGNAGSTGVRVKDVCSERALSGLTFALSYTGSNRDL